MTDDAGKSVFVHRDGQPVQFSLAQANVLLAQGQLSLDDPAWQEGLPEWGTLGKIEGILPPPGPTMAMPPVASLGRASRPQPGQSRKRHLKMIAMIGSVFTLLLVVGGLIVFGVFQSSLPEAPQGPPTPGEVQALQLVLHSTDSRHHPKALVGTWKDQSSFSVTREGNEISTLNFSVTIEFIKNGQFQMTSRVENQSEGSTADSEEFHQGVYTTLNGRIYAQLGSEQTVSVIFNHNDGALILQGAFEDGKYKHYATLELTTSNQNLDVIANKLEIGIREMMLAKSRLTKQ